MARIEPVTSRSRAAQPSRQSRVFRISRIGRISAPTNSFFHLSCFLFLPSFASFWISKYISKSLALANAHAQFFLSLSHTLSCTHTRTLAQMHTSTLFPPTCCDSIKINTTRSRWQEHVRVYLICSMFLFYWVLFAFKLLAGSYIRIQMII